MLFNNDRINKNKIDNKTYFATGMVFTMIKLGNIKVENGIKIIINLYEENSYEVNKTYSFFVYPNSNNMDETYTPVKFNFYKVENITDDLIFTVSVIYSSLGKNSYIEIYKLKEFSKVNTVFSTGSRYNKNSHDFTDCEREYYLNLIKNCCNLWIDEVPISKEIKLEAFQQLQTHEILYNSENLNIYGKTDLFILGYFRTNNITDNLILNQRFNGMFNLKLENNQDSFLRDVSVPFIYNYSPPSPGSDPDSIEKELGFKPTL